MVITITIFTSVISVSAESVSGDFGISDGSYLLQDVTLYLINGSDKELVDCSVVGESVGEDLLVTVRPKDQLEFLLFINQGYDLNLVLQLNVQTDLYLVFNNYLPLQFTGSSETQVSENVFNAQCYGEFTNQNYSFNVTDNISELSFAFSLDESFDFPVPEEPSGFLLFLSDVGVFFINCLDWFVELFSMVSVSAPLLVLVCGFVIVGFSFSLLRRTVR